LLPVSVNQMKKKKKNLSPNSSRARQAHQRVLPPCRLPAASCCHGGVGAPSEEAGSGPCLPDPVSTTPDLASGGGGGRAEPEGERVCRAGWREGATVARVPLPLTGHPCTCTHAGKAGEPYARAVRQAYRIYVR